MTPVSTNMFHIENFLCFISVRAGTLVSLYLTLIFSFFTSLLMFNLPRQDSSSNFVGVVMIMKFLFSGSALLYFPEMNKKYDKNSMYVKCIRNFSISSGVMVILGFFIFLCVALYGLLNYVEIFMNFAFFTTLWIVVFTHITAVTYSFYLSILQPENPPQEGLINDKANNTSPGRKNDTKIDIPRQPFETSGNETGNLYVELR